MSLSLNCFILGDKPDRTFTVEIPKNKNVSILKDLIKEKKAPHFDHIAASDLDLWLVSFPIDDLETELRNINLAGYQKLSPPSKKLTSFLTDVADDCLHVIAKAPEVQTVVALDSTQFISLNCFILGDDPERTFTVKIPKAENVSILKKLIKEEKAPHFDHIAASDLDLWLVSFPIDDLSSQNPPTVEPKLRSEKLLSDTFPAKLDINHIHVVARVPGRGVKEEEEKHEEHDQVTELIAITRKRYRTSLEKNLNASPPSTSAKSGGYITFQQDGNPIYDGRYVATNPAETRAPPIQLYHPDFGHFLDDFTDKDLKVPAEVVRATACFMGKASGIYRNEDARRSAIRPQLLNVLSIGMEKVVNLDSTSADGVGVTHALMMGEVAATCIEEDKNEFGDGGSDPSTQAGLSYARFWAQRNHTKIRENSCCPSFLIAIAGASIAILGAIWTDKIIVQRFTDYIWLGHDTIFNEDAICRNARILYALAKSLRRLETFYQSLKIHSQPAIPKRLEPRYFPSVNAYRGAVNTTINFTFTVPLESDSVCTTFLAKTEGPASEPIVVKFVHHYNKEAHELLAAKGMAPKLRYCDQVGVRDGDPSYGDLCMVVMDFVDGETVDKAKTFPPMFVQRIQDILDVLHQADFVFGDLRGPNVMITKNDEVVFIDFDMVGKHGESRYPIMMSPCIKWAANVADGLHVMLKEHDLEMLERLVAKLSLSSI